MALKVMTSVYVVSVDWGATGQVRPQIISHSIHAGREIPRIYLCTLSRSPDESSEDEISRSIKGCNGNALRILSNASGLSGAPHAIIGIPTWNT